MRVHSNTEHMPSHHHVSLSANQDAGRNCTLDAEKPPSTAEPASEPASDDIDPDDELAMWEGIDDAGTTVTHTVTQTVTMTVTMIVT